MGIVSAINAVSHLDPTKMEQHDYSLYITGKESEWSCDYHVTLLALLVCQDSGVTAASLLYYVCVCTCVCMYCMLVLTVYVLSHVTSRDPSSP